MVNGALGVTLRQCHIQRLQHQLLAEVAAHQYARVLVVRDLGQSLLELMEAKACRDLHTWSPTDSKH